MRIFTIIALLCSASFVLAQDFTIQTSASTGENFSFQLNAFNRSVTTLSIDWGDGNQVAQTDMPDAKGKTYTAPAGVSGSKSIKIYSNGVEGILLTKGENNPIVIDNFTVGATNFLTLVQLNECDLKAANFSNAALLEEVALTGNLLTTLDLQASPITKLNIANASNLSSIALAAGSSVKELNLNNSAITDASLSQILANTPSLEKINLNYSNTSNKISAVDFSANTELKSITVMNNAVTGVMDLTGLNRLEEANFYENGLTGFISTSPVLTKLTLTGNGLTSVDLDGCILLAELNCANNSTLTSIDLTSNVALTDVYLQKNALESIKFASGITLNYLNVGENALNFSTLPRVAVSGSYTYAIQSGVLPISNEKSDLYSIDMSKYLTTITEGPVPGTLGEKSTVNRVMGYKGTTPSPLPGAPLPAMMWAYTETNGKYTFNPANMNQFTDMVYFEVKNAAFPALTLKTSEVELGKAPVGIDPSEDNNTTIVYYNSASAEIYYEVEGAQSISVINIIGQVAHKQSLVSDKDAVSVNNLAKGVYVVQITTNTGKTITQKVVIK